MALVLPFPSAGNDWKSTVGRFANLADFGSLPERLLLSVRKKSINEKFVNIKLQPLLFLTSSFNAFSFLRVSANALYDCRFIYFHSLIKSTFLLSIGLLCLYDRQYNACRYGISLLVFSIYRVKHLKGTSVSTRAHVLFYICRAIFWFYHAIKKMWHVLYEPS